MKFMKFKFRRADIILVPLMCIIMFGWQYYSIKQDVKKQDKELAKKLDMLAEKCRNGNKQSCDEYTLILTKTVSSE